jgi:hypothetical protein
MCENDAELLCPEQPSDMAGEITASESLADGDAAYSVGCTHELKS